MITNEECVQGSPEWLAMRMTKIGASEASIILGISPYKTAFELWEEKTGRVTPPPPHAGMLRGQQLEPMIRAQFEAVQNDSFMPRVVVHPEYEWMIASLDGINFTGDTLLEIKTCNKEVFEKCKRGEVVPYYYSQIQHQFSCVPEAKFCYYVCYHADMMEAMLVERDEEYIERLIEAEKVFYQCMVTDTTPAKTEQDEAKERPVIDDEEALQAANDYMMIDEECEIIKCELKKLEQRKKVARQKLLDHTDDGNCTIGYLQLTRSEPKGLVDWGKVQESYGIPSEDLEKFRKPGSVRWTITNKDKT